LERSKASFWQAENYDHYVCEAPEMDRIVAYILNKSAKAGLLEDGLIASIQT
jgi:hypothetical protein